MKALPLAATHLPRGPLAGRRLDADDSVSRRGISPAAGTTLWGILLAAVIAAAAVAPAGAQQIAAPAPGAASEPAAASAPAAGSTAWTAKASSPTSKAASEPATQPAAGGHDEALSKELVRASCASFVIVEFWYKKDLSESAAVIERDYNINRLYDDYIDKKRPEQKPGIVLDDKGHVLITDDGLEERFLDRILVRDVQGRLLAAKRSKLLFDAPGVVLEVDPSGAKELHGLSFEPVDGNDINVSLQQSRLFQMDDAWRVSISSLSPTVDFARGDPNNVFFGYRSVDGSRRNGRGTGPAIIADANGLPVGCATASYMDLKQTEGLWKGKDLVGAAGMDWPQLLAAQEQQRKRIIESVQEVIITLRGDNESSHHSFGGSASGQEISVYGVAVSPTEIVIPRTLEATTAGQIERMDVKFSPSVRSEAEFVGAYKDFGAIVVKLKKGTLPTFLAMSPSDLPPMKPFWEARMRKRSGDKYVDLIANRISGKAEGYQGKYHWYASREMLDGSMLLDFQGRLAGFYLPQRVENEEEHKLEATGRYSRPRAEVRIFPISEIRQALEKPQGLLDPKIIVKTRTESKRRAWLGVEFIGMTPDLAEQFKVENPTKDGQLGFVVNAVYDHSPAQRLGIQVGDILLKLQDPNMQYPLELTSQMARGEDRGYSVHGRMGGLEDEDDGSGPAEQTWHDRNNPFTRALDAIGIGKKVELTYYHRDANGGGELKTLDYTIEQAPLDFESAPRWQNRKLGPTVKNLTYEIRYALNLKDSDPGVIVAKVEDGSPMIIARVFPNEIVTHLDDKPLHSARQMRDMIAAAHKEGREKVRLTVLHMGKTRFADMAVTEYDPADDEGLDEK